MNIKEHIDAGHYPTDKYGFACVPRELGDVSIVTTNGPSPAFQIVGARHGKMYGWNADGEPYLGVDGFSESTRLLPPPPRKVKVVHYAEVDRESGKIVATSNTGRLGMSAPAHWVCVELTGEYEQPW